MIRNLVEEHVRQSLEALKAHFPAFCPCGEAQCTEDVLVYALNRIPPRYVTTPEGQAVTELALEKQQQRAEIDVVVMEALRRVSMAPRCPKARARAG
jgi:competence protein ComFB